MLLTIDIGNTNTRLGVFDGDTLVTSWNVSTAKECTEDELVLLLRNLTTLYEGETPLEITDAILASVVPQVTQQWQGACSRITGKRCFVVGPGLKTGIRMNYGDPSGIGADRIADFIAASRYYGVPCIIVDLGTATNIEVIDRDGAFCGGLIAPGFTSSAVALTKAAAQLSMVNMTAPERVVGKSTREAIQSGVFFGEVARIDGLVERIWDELGYETRVISTGGAAPELSDYSRHIEVCDLELTLKGLQLLFEKNRK